MFDDLKTVANICVMSGTKNDVVQNGGVWAFFYNCRTCQDFKQVADERPVDLAELGTVGFCTGSFTTGLNRCCICVLPCPQVGGGG